MDDEILKIYDNYMNEIGSATRKDVHKYGYWHQVFSCIFYSYENNIPYLYFQIRSSTKNDYPNMLDVTVAGHLLAHENLEDGIREIKEEIGITIDFHQLISLGKIKYSIKKDDFIDKEIANIFAFILNNLPEMVTLQDEVSGIIKIKFTDFANLWLGTKETANIQGFELNSHGKKIIIDTCIRKERFLPYPDNFYLELIEKINTII